MGTGNKVLSSSLLSLLLSAVSVARAETLFEAYYSIERDNQHVGYVVQRLVRNRKTSTETLTTYIRSRQNGKETARTFRTEAHAGSATPMASRYNGYSGYSGSAADGTSFPPSAIVAHFDKGASTGRVEFFAGGKKAPHTTQKQVKPPLLSSFVFFAADLPKFRLDKAYGYYAFAEDYGRATMGTLRMVDDKTAAGAHVLHVVDDFFGQSLENFVAEGGEPLGSRNLALKTVCRWVAGRDAAVGSMTFPKAEIHALFGDLPKGAINPWSKLAGFDSSAVIDAFTKPLRPPPLSLAERRRSVASMPVRSL